MGPDVYVTDDNVTQCIHEIRAALSSASGQILRTLPRRGYLFTPEVIALPAAERPHPVNGVNGTASALRPKRREAEPASVESGAIEPASSPNASIAHRPSPRHSILIGPLRNLGLPKEYEYLVAAIPEDICSDLSIHRGLLAVVGLPEVGSRGSDGAGLRAIGRELGVGYVLDGSIRGIVDRLAVNLQLVEVATGLHLWSEQFDIDLGGTTGTRIEMTSRAAFTIFQQFVEQVSRALATFPREDWTPDDLVKRGRALLLRPMNSPGPNPREALDYFEQALVVAPHSIQARLGVARVLVRMGSVGSGRRGGPEEVRAEQLLADILAVDGDDVAAHTLMGIIRRTQFRLKDSLDAFTVAMRLAPNHAPVISNLGLTLALLGQPDAAIPLIEKGLRISPRGYYAPISHAFLGLCHLLNGHAQTAIPSLRTARAINPRMSFIHLWLAAALGLNGEQEEAGAALKQALAMQPNVVRDMFRDRLLIQRASPEYVSLFSKTVYAGLLLVGLHDVAAKADTTSLDAEDGKA